MNPSEQNTPPVQPQPAPPSTIIQTPLPEKPNLISKILKAIQSHKKILIPIVVITILLLVSILIYFLLFNKKERIKVLPGTVSIKPIVEDSMGVDKTSGYLLTSKEPITGEAINDNLAIKPEVPYDLQKVNDLEYKIIPKEELSPGKIYQFQLTTENPTIATNSALIAERELSWAFQIKNPFRVVNTIPGKKGTSVPINSGIEITFSHENFKDIDNYFEISPKVDGRFERHKRTAVFVSKGLQSGTLYTVTLKKGLELEGTEEKLNEDYTFQFETDSYNDPSRVGAIFFNREMSEFPTNEIPAFKISSSYESPATSAQITVYKFSSFDQFLSAVKEKGKIPSWSYSSRSKYVYPTTSLQKMTEFNAPLQNIDYYQYFSFPEKLPEGYYVVEAKSNNKATQTWLQITDVSTYLSVSETKSLAWVNNVATGQPIVNASVELIGTNTKSTTGTDGSAYFDTPEILKDKESEIDHYLKVSDQGGKSILVPIELGGYYARYNEGRTMPSDNYWSYLYADKPVYLPTDKVNFWGVIRNRDNLKEQPKLKIVLTNSQYLNFEYKPVPILEKEITPSEIGTFIGEMPLTNFQPGYYVLSIKKDDEEIATRGFSVETYTKPAYKIDIEQSKKAIIVGESITFNGKATFFEGTPVPNVSLNYTGLREAQIGDLLTDQKGEFTISYTAPPTQGTGEDYYSSYPKYEMVSVQPTLPEEGEIQGAANFEVFDASIYLKTITDIKDNNGIITITANNLDLSRKNNGTEKSYDDYLGGPAGGVTITAKLFENSWEKKEIGEYYDTISKTSKKTYTYNPVRTFLNDVSVTTNDKGEAVYQFPISQEKFYLLKIEARDNQNRTFYTNAYVYGRQGAYQNTSNDYYYLEQNKKENQQYSIGENVEVTLKNGNIPLPPFGDRYLFRFASRGIKDYKIQDSPNIAFNFSEQQIPNVVLKAIRFNGKTYNESETTSAVYKYEDKELSIDLKPNANSYKPRDKVNLDISVKNKEGKGVSSEVNVSLIDEAIFKIQSFSGDILSSLYNSVPSGVFSSYSSHMLPMAGNMAEGGGCFLPGTKVLMNGTEQKNIEEIKVGDTILTRKHQNSEELVPAKVTNVMKHQVAGYLTLNGFLKVTPEHNLYANGRWMTAGEINLGDYILDRNNKWLKINTITEHKELVDVYNFTVEKYGTYFADNIYVHNEKGREYFFDQAYFGAVKTDGSGNGSVSFTLPDNLTSWRITSQAVTNNLEAGMNTKELPVKLPFFVDLVMNKQYLAGDKPTISLRTFGEALSNQQVEFTIDAPTLNLNAIKKNAPAFGTFDLELPVLIEGEHTITVGAKAGNLEDKITRPIKVVKSYLAKQELSFKPMTADLKLPESPANSMTTIIFSDQNSGKYYSPLKAFSNSYGDRVEQKVTRMKSTQLLRQYFAEELTGDTQSAVTNYQRHDGGIALFPYADSDLAVSVKVAAVASDLFDKNALASYFYKIIDDKKEGFERVLMALAGLASLGEPVLVQLNAISDFDKLTTIEQLYFGIGHARIGNKEKAREIFQKVLSERGENLNPGIRINDKKDLDDTLEATSLAANLAALTQEQTAENLYQYVTENNGKDLLTELDQIQYIASRLNITQINPAQFKYSIEGVQKEVKLEKGESMKLILPNDQLSKLSFEPGTGNVGVTTMYSIPLDESTLNKDAGITLGRSYKVKDQSTSIFGRTDRVEVQLNYTLGPKSVDGCYQVTDILPSGLKPVTKTIHQSYGDTRIWYPYDIDGQKVSFCVDKNSPNKPIIYYARVISKGEYKAEQAVIQSQMSLNSINLSPSGTVSIR